MRERWWSRTIFILAAIGCAVWLWNARRFPWLCAEYWWWAFLLAYIFCMLFLWIPLLMMEFAIWRKMQKSAPLALASINKKAKWIGWAATGNAFFVLTYYAVVFSWCILMCFLSYKFATVASTTEAASTLWQNTIWTTFTTSFVWETINVNVLICFILAWLLLYLSVKDWTKQVWKIVKYTVTLPVIMLIILAVKWFIDNPHLWEALRALFVPDFNAFLNVELWKAALWQSFFSLSIMGAVMIVYGSFLKKDSNIFVDWMIIAVSDLVMSVLSGVVLFTTMYSTGATISDMSASWITTAFMIYPAAIVNLTSSWVFNAIFGFVFYFMLSTLAIDSVFSMLEAVYSAFKDYLWIGRKGLLIIAFIGFVLSLIFISWAGVAFIDIVDHWINQYGMIIVWILESVLIWWFFSPKKVLEEINRNTGKYKMPSWWFNFSVKFFSPFAISFLLIWEFIVLFKNNFRYNTDYDLWVEIILWWFVLLLSLTCWFIIDAILKRTKKWKEVLSLQEKNPMWDDIES